LELINLILLCLRFRLFFSRSSCSVCLLRLSVFLTEPLNRKQNAAVFDSVAAAVSKDPGAAPLIASLPPLSTQAPPLPPVVVRERTNEVRE
jgi:hypothetical protein